MKKGLLVAVLLILFSINLVSALETEVELYTLPSHDIIVNLLEPGAKYQSLKIFKGRTDFNGLYDFNFSLEKSEVDVAISLKRNGQVVEYERLEESIIIGQKNTVYFKVDEDDVGNGVSIEEIEETNTSEQDTNATSGEEIIEEEVVDEVEESESPIITGQSVSNVKELLDKTKYYIFGFLVVAILVTIVLLIVRHHPHRQVKKAALHSDDRPPTILTDKELEDAEKKLREAQKEFREVRAHYSHKAAAEERLRKAKEELKKAEEEANGKKEESENKDD